MAATSAQEKIDAYLSRLRACLRGMSNEEIDEIVEELHSHILDKSAVSGESTASDADAALEGLGRPEESN